MLGVAAAGAGRPLDVGVFPRVRLPTIVLKIVLGIVIGPSGVGWAKPDDVVLARELLYRLEPELVARWPAPSGSVSRSWAGGCATSASRRHGGRRAAGASGKLLFAARSAGVYRPVLAS
jgi:hypothetical protein